MPHNPYALPDDWKGNPSCLHQLMLELHQLQSEGWQSGIDTSQLCKAITNYEETISACSVTSRHDAYLKVCFVRDLWMQSIRNIDDGRHHVWEQAFVTLMKYYQA